MSRHDQAQLARRKKGKKLSSEVEPAGKSHADQASELGSSLNPPLAALAAVLLSTVAAYAQIASHPFVIIDDDIYVTANPHIQTGLTWKTVSWAMTAIYGLNWHPLTWLSHALDIQLFGLEPAGHHLTNLLLHVTNVALLYLLMSIATRSVWRSVLVAALFALHPLNVESVAWVAERKNLLSTLFFFLALGAYGRYVGKPGVGRYLVVAGLFLLGLASKPMVITLPFVLVLLDFWPLERLRPHSGFTLRQSIIEKLPLFAMSAADAVVTIYAQSRGGTTVLSVVELPLWLRLENATCAYAKYVAKAFWPGRLAPIYPLSKSSLTLWQTTLAALFLVLVSYYVWRRRTQHRYALVGWLWFLVTLVPVIGIVQVGRQAMADRYAYIPLIGIFVMVVWGALELSEALRLGFPVQAMVSAIPLALLTFLTWRQARFWGSDYDLWTHTLAVTQENVLAEYNLAMTLVVTDRLDEAVPHLQNVKRLEPNNSSFSSGTIYLATQSQAHNRFPEAIAEYEAALHLTSDPEATASIFVNLWTMYTRLRDYGRASASLDLAAQADSAYLVVTVIPKFEQSVETNPSPQHCLQLGQLLERTGQVENARSLYQRSLQLDPSYEAARQALARLDSSHG